VETIDAAYRGLLWASTIFLSLLIFVFIIQAIRGPRFSDRIVAINLVCTKGIIMIAVLSYTRSDTMLLDVALVYSLISFLVVLVLSKCYVSLHHNDPYNLVNLSSAPKTGDSAGETTKENIS